MYLVNQLLNLFTPKNVIMKILIIDKYPIIRVGLALLLRKQYPEATVLEMETFVSGGQKLIEKEPDVIILSIDGASPNNDQFVMIELRKYFISASIIAYDNQAHYDTLIACFKNGMNGYLSKQSNLDELFDCIAKVLSGDKYVNNEMLIKLMIEQNSGKVQESKSDQSILTTSEKEIASYLCRGMKTSMIAQTMKKNSSTISTMKRNIFKKLSVDNVVSLRERMRQGTWSHSL